MAAERRSRINLYVGPAETIIIDSRDPAACAAARAKLAALDASGDYLHEEKHDGDWCLAEVSGGRVKLLASRTGLAHTDAGDLLGMALAPAGEGRLVGELTADQDVLGAKVGQRRLHLFDVVEWAGHDLRELPQVERREALELVYGTFAAEVRAGGGDRVRLVEQRTSGALAYFDEVVGRGGEGLVSKCRDARYRSARADGKVESWIRTKKQRSVDYIVISHGKAEKGTPNLQLGLYFPKGGGMSTPGGRELRFVLDVTLPPHWRHLGDLTGRVVEAKGWEVFPSGALRSAQVGHRAGPRADKSPGDCTWEAALAA